MKTSILLLLFCLTIRGFSQISNCTTDQVAPDIQCYQGTAVIVINEVGAKMIRAKDFDAGTTDNCTDSDSLLFSFDAEGVVLSKTLTKADVGEFLWDFYAQDQAGNVNSCKLKVKIVENPPTNQDTSKLDLKGAVTCGDGIFHHKPYQFKVRVMDRNGNFQREIYPPLITIHAVNANYGLDLTKFDINPEHELLIQPVSLATDFFNGVSTLDIVHIIKHILGFTEFPADSIRQLIAADVNQDGRISALDVAILRRTLLGLHDQLPPSYVFYPEEVTLRMSELPYHKLDFLAIKVGNVSSVNCK